MKTVTIEQIKSWNPCYPPEKYLSEGWSGTAIDILNMDNVPFEHRLWAVLRVDFVSEKLLRLYAVWCARQVQHLMHDKRSIDALNVVERFANGEATSEELYVAGNAARAATRDATWAAWAATWAAAAAAARAATSGAAESEKKHKLIEMILAGVETGDTK